MQNDDLHDLHDFMSFTTFTTSTTSTTFTTFTTSCPSRPSRLHVLHDLHDLHVGTAGVTTSSAPRLGSLAPRLLRSSARQDDSFVVAETTRRRKSWRDGPMDGDGDGGRGVYRHDEDELHAFLLGMIWESISGLGVNAS
ncbi:hypothetical protein EYF80_010612 [Liparis tanakae]|uniref:Uncharacterized protein n=1 Tax=Liparis tanakae TaxID=230148 RepID=A0A4Z2INY2_9TELE|nr:hypothetical protein EYF80_010612 [Liparis tanakae]